MRWLLPAVCLSVARLAATQSKGAAGPGMVMGMIVHVGLESWIVQDGNYGEFEAGSNYRFALEFYPLGLLAEPEPSGKTGLRCVIGAEHEVQGRVVCATDSRWVVDIGVPAFQQSKPPRWVSSGGAFAGRTYLGIDPFFYFEQLKDEPGMPDLFRNWRVCRIHLETTPWNETTTSRGGKLVERAKVTRTFVEVPRTDCWNDDNGVANYVLECELQEAG